MPRMRIWLGSLSCALILVVSVAAGAPLRGPGAPGNIASVAQAGQLAAQQATATPPPAGAVRGQPPLSLTLMLLFSCCAIGLVIGVLVVGVVAARGNRAQGNVQGDEQKERSGD